MAEAQEVSRSTVARIWKAYGLHPDKIRAFKFPKANAFEEKLADVAGLRSEPPAAALMWCVADLVRAIEDYMKTRNQRPRPLACAEKVEGFLETVNRCKVIMETLHDGVRSLAFTVGKAHASNEREDRKQSEEAERGTSRSRRDKEVAMNWIEKIRMYFAAAAFAEEGEHETALRMAGLPGPMAAQPIGVLQGFTRACAAAAFAEENCPEIAREILSGGARKNSFLDAVGLKGVRIYYGTVPMRESFAEAIGLGGAPFKLMTVWL